MWMLLFLFFVQANPNPCQGSPALTQSPSLIVQVVDPMWLPVPGAEVKVKPLHGDAQSKSSRRETDQDGYAKFVVPGDADYSIEVKSYAFKRERMEDMHLLKTAVSPAYVQLRLRLSDPVTVY